MPEIIDKVLITVRNGRKISQKISVSLKVLDKHLTGKPTNTFKYSASQDKLNEGNTYKFKDCGQNVTLTPLLDKEY